MSKALEKAGFEIQSVENISIHYAMTIQRWHQNWQKQPAPRSSRPTASAGSASGTSSSAGRGASPRRATGQGFQIVAHKNLDTFDRKIFTRHANAVSPVRSERDRDRAPAVNVKGNGTAHAE